MPRALIAALMAAFSPACDETPTTPTGDLLQGRWQVTSMEPRNAAPVIPAPGVVLALEFTDTRVAVQGDCNVCSGTYTLAGSAFSASRLACTLRACREGTIEGPFFQLVSAAATATLVPGDRLRLAGPEGTVDLRRLE